MENNNINQKDFKVNRRIVLKNVFNIPLKCVTGQQKTLEHFIQEQMIQRGTRQPEHTALEMSLFLLTKPRLFCELPRYNLIYIWHKVLTKSLCLFSPLTSFSCNIPPKSVGTCGEVNRSQDGPV